MMFLTYKPPIFPCFYTAVASHEWTLWDSYMTSSVREINNETVPQLTLESSESLTKTGEVTLGGFQEDSNQETQMSAHMNISPLFWGNLASGVKLTTVTTFLYTARRSFGKSQTVRTRKRHQARKGEPLLYLHGPPLLGLALPEQRSPLLHHLRPAGKSEEEGGRGRKGGQEMDGQRRQPTCTMYNRFSSSTDFP